MLTNIIARSAGEGGQGAVKEGHREGAAGGRGAHHPARPRRQVNAHARQRVSFSVAIPSKDLHSSRYSFPSQAPPMMPNGTGFGIPPVSLLALISGGHGLT